MDNGAPWGGWNDLPTDLALWLIGGGIEMIWNHPYCPRENAQVERSHGVLQQWVQPKTCPDTETLQRRLDDASRRQREVYPSVKGVSRLQAYPELTKNSRPFSDWRLERVGEFLAKGRWRRHASKTGQISLYNRCYCVGRAYGNQDVFVHLDACTQEWVMQNGQGAEIARHRAKGMTVEAILNLNVTHRKTPRTTP